jgi:hypothetical protein
LRWQTAIFLPPVAIEILYDTTLPKSAWITVIMSVTWTGEEEGEEGRRALEQCTLIS